MRRFGKEFWKIKDIEFIPNCSCDQCFLGDLIFDKIGKNSKKTLLAIANLELETLNKFFVIEAHEEVFLRERIHMAKGEERREIRMTNMFN